MRNFIHYLPKLNPYPCLAIKYQGMSGNLRGQVRKESDNFFFLISYFEVKLV